jgi:hypothetical protein
MKRPRGPVSVESAIRGGGEAVGDGCYSRSLNVIWMLVPNRW